MTSLLIKFGLRVKELRKKQGLTQENLAEMVGIGVRSLGKIETGNSFPSTDTLEQLLVALKVSPMELFNIDHHDSTENLQQSVIEMILTNPDKIEYIYKVVKALVS